MTLSKYEQDMMGGELPEQEIIDGQPQPIETAKPVPEPEPEPTPVEPETPEEVDPLTKVFREEGLDRQFKSPEEVLRKQREYNRYITQLEQERAEMRRQLQSVPKPEPKAPTPITGEDLYADPNAAVERLGLAKRGDIDPIQQRLDQLELRQVNDEAVGVLSGIEELKDVAVHWKNGTSGTYTDNQTFNRMKELFHANPALGTMAPSHVLPLLYNAVRGERAAVVQQTTTVDPKKKEAATTTSGKSPKIPGQKDASYYSKLSPAEIEKELGFVEPN